MSAGGRGEVASARRTEKEYDAAAAGRFRFAAIRETVSSKAKLLVSTRAKNERGKGQRASEQVEP